MRPFGYVHAHFTDAIMTWWHRQNRLTFHPVHLARTFPRILWPHVGWNRSAHCELSLLAPGFRIPVRAWLKSPWLAAVGSG